MRFRYIPILVFGLTPIGTAYAHVPATPAPLPMEDSVFKRPPFKIVTAVLADANTVDIDETIERAPNVNLTNSPVCSDMDAYEYVRDKVSVHLPVHQLLARRLDGHEISAKDFASSLAKPTAVVLLHERQTLDPLVSKMFKPDTLVLTWEMPGSKPTLIPAAAQGAEPAKR